jgi:hypothetical protein
MVNRPAVYRFLIPVLLLASGVFLYAQEPAGSPAAEGDYFIEPRFVQRLSWDHDPLVFRYEVILEEERDGEYKEQLRESTQENSLELSLRPGRYRYAVQVYNLYRKLEYTMDWEYFTVLSALKPEILSFFPEVFILDTESPRQITLTGRNIDPQALIMLRRRGVPLEETGGIRPRSIALEGNTALLTFDTETLAPGIYDVYIRNPGGLEGSLGIFTVRLHESEEGEIAAGVPGEPDKPVEKTSRRFDIIASAGYAPFIPLYGDLFSDGVFENPFVPLGFAARAGLLPLKRNWGYVGAELNVSWHRLEEEKDDYTVAAHDIGAHLNLLYQLWLPNRIMALNFRLGTGINLIADFYFDYGDGRDDPLTSVYLSLDTGISFQWRIKGTLFAEAGIDFIHIFSPDDEYHPGYLRPTLSIGGQF